MRCFRTEGARSCNMTVAKCFNTCHPLSDAWEPFESRPRSFCPFLHCCQNFLVSQVSYVFCFPFIKMPAAVLGISRPGKRMHSRTRENTHARAQRSRAGIFTKALGSREQTRPRGASCHNSPDCTAFRKACRVNLSVMRGRQWCHHYPPLMSSKSYTYTPMRSFPSVAISVWCGGNCPQMVCGGN